MVVQCMHEFNAPLQFHDWCQRWCCAVHNIAASRKLNWLSPRTIVDGYTPDISPFRFHFWEPIWYYQPGQKSPKSSWLPGRWLGFAHSVGDHFTYYVRIEKPKGRNVVLVRNIVTSRRKHIGTDREHTDNNPIDDEMEQFTLDPRVAALLAENPDPPDNLEDVPQDKDDDNEMDPDLKEQEPNLGGEELETILNEMEDYHEDDYQFDKIVDHSFQEGVLMLKTRYWSAIMDDTILIEVPFPIAKKEQPVAIAKYIRQYVQDERRNGFFNSWAQKTLKAHSRSIRRLHRLYNVDASMRVMKMRHLKPTTGTTTSTKSAPIVEKYGIKIPRNTREALLLDKQNRNNKWGEAIMKEMKSLDTLRVFKYHDPGTKFRSTEGWQYAPLHMIYTVKHDLRHKARLVCGGNVLDASAHVTYSSTVQNLTIRMLMILAVQNNLKFLTGDIGNAFCTAPCREKVWTIAGPEFGEKQGCVVSLCRALYGLSTASRAFHEFLGATLLDMGFKPSRADQDLWIRKSDDYDGYDYIATHVDDIIIVAKDPSKYMTQLEQDFKLRDVSDSPEYYLGNDLRQQGNTFHISSAKYVKEAIRKYQSMYGNLRKQKSPMKKELHPERDESPLLGFKDHRRYQHIIGVCQWAVTAGRMDIQYAVTALSRYAAAPRQGHLTAAEHLLGYLKTYPCRGYLINPKEPQIDPLYKVVTLPTDFGNQYNYFQEDIDPRFPTVF